MLQLCQKLIAELLSYLVVVGHLSEIGLDVPLAGVDVGDFYGFEVLDYLLEHWYILFLTFLPHFLKSSVKNFLHGFCRGGHLLRAL